MKKNKLKKSHDLLKTLKNVHAEARKIGFAGVMRLIWKDLFVGRSLFQWLYLIVLSMSLLFWSLHKTRKVMTGLVSWPLGQGLSALSW